MSGSFPHRMTLCFRNKRERDWFMGQLSDGFGENECDLKWTRGKSLDEVREVDVLLPKATLARLDALKAKYGVKP